MHLRGHQQFDHSFGLVCAALLLLTKPLGVTGADLYVNNQTGYDANPGTVSRPLASAKRAVKNARPGDTVHLLPSGAIYRETLTFNNKTNLVIEGSGCTLSGTDPLPFEASEWEAVAMDLGWSSRLSRKT